jgi:hypothetical protein
VTDDTSSPSVRDITLVDGQPPTDPSSETTSDESKAMMFEILQARYPGYTIIDGTEQRAWWQFRVRAELGRIKHALGAHWYIEGEEYDAATDSVRYAGFHCFYCDKQP